ncbi:HTH domain-containing protein [Methylobacterium oxalidis]|uniref:HTH HARE-type domain-containing protein n=1 Tax=Methylobacterium oxalidis TaxID=944322 RepID=A0A512J141_9HYPH|nr:HTH domain-containing protein [Methylobacterium oxalidis]GEP03655.1 hypothetical protein MOX02_16930 [Methylobacterium oxalidis]GJE34362.1 hypothetical protein LDDCCGHA_4573 [Methylobacterium oxalidis]GLS64982.1 hypothetical protein GCM10007888_33630 [Methylobacterium oxalidis]
MFPSEAEIEERLAALRRRREALDRLIADHALYLELGRRLRGPGPREGNPLSPEHDPPPENGPEAAAGPLAAPAPRPSPEPDPGTDPAAEPARPAERSPAEGSAPLAETPAPPEPAGDEAVGPEEGGFENGGPEEPGFGGGVAEAGPAAPLAIPFEEDPVAARRYGRALVAAAVAALEEAGRPLHAGEILERIGRRGFTLPGQDPVAALNTRLWKRSGPGGPVRRLGEAVYALPEA